ncbi:MAG: DUF1156 domain-containing protein [Deltaproteobacteria bacterium]|nr:DUF1156 domain-containing protein [Deltaproteobacteria bacterium]
MPLEAINKASSREKSIRHGHPATLHIWWARRPLAVARAILFASIINDPSSRPERFPTLEAQEAERQRLFEIIKKLVVWENSNDQRLLAEVKAEISKATEGAPLELLDPFAGGGTIPLEGQRLGLKVFAGDLNPVAVMINKAMIEIPVRFSGLKPVRPLSDHESDTQAKWERAAGLAEDIGYYAQVIANRVITEVGNLYPEAILPGPVGEETPVIAWIWARTVKCPNPACGLITPLTHSFELVKGKKEVSIEPLVKNGQISYEIKNGPPKNPGTITFKGAQCCVCHSQISKSYIMEEGQNGRIKNSLMAIVTKDHNGKVYLPPNDLHSRVADTHKPPFASDEPLPYDPRTVLTSKYGITRYSDIFTPRQLTFLTVAREKIIALRPEIEKDAKNAGLAEDGLGLEDGGTGAKAYSEAVLVYLSFLLDKMADYHSSLCAWNSSGEKIRNTFFRQSLPMVWDYAECNPFSEAAGSFKNMVEWIVKSVRALPAKGEAKAEVADAMTDGSVKNALISTDPPYYDNIIYSNISDYYYIWLRSSLKSVYKSVFSTILAPKSDELVVAPYRFEGDSRKARIFYETGLKKAFANIYQNAHADYPVTIYCPFKQNDIGLDAEGKIMPRTGWETMLMLIVESGFTVTASWPFKTEMESRLGAFETNSFLGSIVFVLRKKDNERAPAALRDFQKALKEELPPLLDLRSTMVSLIDLNQVAIGLGMSVYSRYSKILEPDGSSLSVRRALAIINEVVNNYLTDHESGLDSESALCLSLFEQYKLKEIGVGLADTEAWIKNSSVDRLVARNVVETFKGGVRLLGLYELPTTINPEENLIWLLAHQLTFEFMTGGLNQCAEIVKKIDPNRAKYAVALIYHLYRLSLSENMVREAFAYKALVMAWPEIMALAQEL